MKGLKILAISLMANSLFGQVGIGTTTPNAALEINSNSNGVLIPSVSLTANNVTAPVVNPTGGSLVVGTLVYNNATAGVSPNDVAPGFYYWSGTQWIKLTTQLTTTNPNWSIEGNPNTTTGTNFIGTTDAIDFVTKTNNVERMRVTSSGDVGIGTNNPTSKLHLKGASYASGIGIERTDTSSNWGIAGVQSGGLQFFDKAAGDATRMIIDGADGNVGIGTFTPSDKLTVHGNGKFYSNNYYLTLDRNDDTGFHGIQLASTGTPRSYIGLAGMPSHFAGESDQYDLIIRSEDDIILGAAGAGTVDKQLWIKANGNVGIGTTTPTYKTEIHNMITSNNGALYVQAGLNGSGKGIVVDANTRTIAEDGVPLIETINRDGNPGLVATVGGNVGIGTTAPSAKLHVSNGDNSIIKVGPNTSWGATLDIGGVYTGSNANARVTTTNGNLHFDAADSVTGGGKAGTYINYYNDSNIYMCSGTYLQGSVGIGTTAPLAKLHVTGVTAGLLGNGGYGYSFASGGVIQYGTTDNNTSIYASNNILTSGTIYAISDKREKKDIKDIEYGLETVMNIRPTEYVKKDYVQHGNRKELGFIAQEMEKIVPEVVSKMKGDVAVMEKWEDFTPEDDVTYNLVIKDQEGEVKWKKGDDIPAGEKFVKSMEVEDKRSVSYDAIVPILTKAIQEQQNMINELKAKLEKLEKKNIK